MPYPFSARSLNQTVVEDTDKPKFQKIRSQYLPQKSLKNAKESEKISCRVAQVSSKLAYNFMGKKEVSKRQAVKAPLSSRNNLSSCKSTMLSNRQH